MYLKKDDRYMKAYKIKISLLDSNPLIWRRVIVPANITFKRLHEIIQFTMGWLDNRLYDFNINEEKIRITCDEQLISDYERYSKMKLTPKNDPYGYVAKMLQITPKHSSKVKIDKYLTNWRKIEYVYDFGDYWIHNIALEEIIENYEYNYPTCLEGEGACPPDDVGGIPGYERFLRIIKDKTNPKYKEIKVWAEEHSYNEIFDIKKVNAYLSEIL